MTNYYYGGQGSLGVATIVAGVPQGLVQLGNVPNLSIDIETTEFSHRESESGNRLEDIIITQQKSGNFTFAMENVEPANLALALWGTKAVIAGSTVTTEIQKAFISKKIILDFPDVSSVVVTGPAGTPTYTVTTDYIVDAKNGTIIPTLAGSISEDELLEVDYTYAGMDEVMAFTLVSAPERHLRFEGLNTVDSSYVIVDIWKARIAPLTGYELINDEIAAPEVTGNILADATKLTGSQFFRQWNVAA